MAYSEKLSDIIALRKCDGRIKICKISISPSAMLRDVTVEGIYVVECFCCYHPKWVSFLFHLCSLFTVGYVMNKPS